MQRCWRLDRRNGRIHEPRAGGRSRRADRPPYRHLRLGRTTLLPAYGPTALHWFLAFVLDQAAREADFVALCELNPQARGRWRNCTKALEKDPERRYATAIEFERALRRDLSRRRIMVGALIALALVAVGLIALRPGPNAPRPGPNASGGPDVPQPAPSVPLAKIVSLEVDHYRGNPAKLLGRVGLTAPTMLVDDDVLLSAQLETPGYAYLIALNTDGTIKVCLPQSVSDAPPQLTDMKYPPKDEFYYPMSEGKGIQAFVVVASRKPLVPFSKWSGGERLEQLWQPAEGDGAWRYDGKRPRPIANTTRGEPRSRSGTPEPFVKVCDYLANYPEFDSVQGIAFSVKEKSPAEKGSRRDPGR